MASLINIEFHRAKNPWINLEKCFSEEKDNYRLKTWVLKLWNVEMIKYIAVPCLSVDKIHKEPMVNTYII